MEDALVKGLIVGLVFGAIGYVADQVWKLIRSDAEGARRFKIVGGVALLLLVGSVLVAMMGFAWAIVVGVAIAAITWVVKGFKSSNGSANVQANFPAEANAAEFSKAHEAASEQKTVIACPNCGGKLRVIAGKFIDVSCPHCKTVFRTHT